MARIPRLLPLIAVAIGGVVVIRAIGVAPGLFEGAKAWAEEAVPAGAAPKPAAAVCALTPEQLAQQAGISPAELRIIQSLSARRAELDARDTDMASMLPLLTAAEQKLDARVQALEAVKAEVAAMLGQVDEKQKAENDRLVAVYSAMRPREAARVFATLDDDVRLPVAAAMRPRTLAAVMAQMDPAAARVLTEKLARRFADQQALAARAAAAATDTPAPAPVQAAAPAAATPTPQPAAGAPAAATPTPRPAAQRPPARRPAAAARPPARTPAPAAAEPAGERPYQPSAAAPASGGSQPRQSVQ
jgi:flagellar motility protein MotE (MotC chaperone)